MKSFSYKEEYRDSSLIDSSDFLNTLRSRRSIRKYKKDALPEEVIHDLIQCAVTAPSGSNCQDWDFTVINDNEKVWDLALKIKDSVKKFNSFVKNPFFRYTSTIFLGNTLLKYHEHLDSIEWAIEVAEKGNDLLFRSAPTLIIFHSHMEGSTPLEDAQYASYNCALMAHSMGLGTGYIGYAVEILNRMKNIKTLCQIPQTHRVHAVLTAGYPDTSFSHLTLRKNYNINFI
jgi:nitroreductase